MLIGSALPGEESFVYKQEAVVNELKHEFTGLRERERLLGEQITGLEREVSLGEAFAANVLPLLVEGRLLGRTVFILSSRMAAVHDRLQDVLHRAGAEVRFVRFNPAAPQDAIAAVNTAAAGGDAAIIVLADEKPAAGEDGIRTLVGGLRRAGLTVIGAETRDAQSSLIPLFKRMGVASVDDADLTAGAITLVFLLDGWEGHYGIKETAEAMFPYLMGGDAP